MPEAVIVWAVRPDELLAHVLEAAVARVGLDPALVEDVVAGCVTQVGEQGFNIARVAAPPRSWSCRRSGRPRWARSRSPASRRWPSPAWIR